MTLLRFELLDIKHLVRDVEEKYNRYHDHTGRFTTAGEAHLIVHPDGRRELGPKHPDHPDNQKPKPLANKHPDDHWQQQYESARKSTWSAFASKHGMSYDDYVKAADQKAQDLVGKAEMWMRTSPKALDSILSDGSFKNAFQVPANPSAKYSLSTRKQAEENLFGNPASMDANERPIYGYMSNDSNGGGSWRLDGYGAIAIKMDKAALSDRVTITAEDSMGSTGGGTSPKMIPQPLTEANSKIFNISTNPNPFHYGAVDPLSVRSIESGMSNDQFRYIETQTHGGVTTQHISEVVFSGKKPTIALQKKLKAAGVSWRVG